MRVFSKLGRWVGLFCLCFFFIGFVHGSAVMYMVGFFCLAVLLGASIFARLALRGLRCERLMPGATAYTGDPLEGKIRITETRGRWRLLEVYDQHVNLVTGQRTRRRMTLLTEGPESGRALVAGSRQPARLTADRERVLEVRDVMRFARRGHYRLGPLVVHSHDPFGLLHIVRTLPMQDELIVYPRPLPLPEIVVGGPGGRQHTEVRPSGNAGESAEFHGIRPYVQGDDLRRVHWKATAHTGRLTVKEYAYHFSGAVQVVLDLQAGLHVGQGEFSTLEAAITLAASILNHTVETGNQAGLLATGAAITRLAPESGQRQLHRALETLALARDDGTLPLAQVLTSGEAQQSRHGTTIVITPSVDLGVIGPLLALRGRSAQVLLVLINPRSFADAEAAQRKPRNLFSQLAKFTIDRKTGMLAPPRHRRVPDEVAHRDLLHAAAAAGIAVYPVGANLPLHKALQGIRTHI